MGRFSQLLAVTLPETSSYISFVLCYTVLRRIELEVLSTVDRGDTISELATKLDHSESYLSCAVADLVEKGLVYTERDGRRKRVSRRMLAPSNSIGTSSASTPTSSSPSC